MRGKETTLEELARELGGRVEGDPLAVVRGLNTLTDALEDEVTFLTDIKYKGLLKDSKALAVIADRAVRGVDKSFIITENPSLGYAKAVAHFAAKPLPEPGLSPRAEVAGSAKIGRDVAVMPFAYVGERAVIGDFCVLYPHTYVGRDSSVGEGTILFPGAVVMDEVKIGRNVVLHPNAVVGSDGFGYARDKEVYVKIPQVGTVEIEDGVEVGAGTTIDRASLGVTRLGRGTKIDNLVQVAHNVVTGENCILVGQCGLSGSVTLGKNVIVAGQAGVAQRLSIGDFAVIAPKAGVAKPVARGQQVAGVPAIDARVHLKALTVFKDLPELKRALRSLRKKVEQLRKKVDEG